MDATTALTKRTADTALMPPPPPAKRIKRPPKVLDEDTYTSALSHIIARDFFPGLLETETQQDYLDALETDDAEWIEEAGKRLRQVMTPVAGYGRRRRGVSMTPRSPFHDSSAQTPLDWKGATPASNACRATPASGDFAPAGAREHDGDAVDLNMSLASFQARYTSQDNESFNRVLDRQNIKRADKHAWMWQGNKLLSRRQIAQAACTERRLIRDNDGPSTAVDLPTQRLSQDQDARPASIDARLSTHDPRNPFMFDPPALSDTHPTLPTVAQVAQVASAAPPKAVHYTNTRFPLTTVFETPIPASPSISAIDAAIRRTGPPPPSTTTSTIGTHNADGSVTPRVNGYAFVDADPAPHELRPPATGASTTDNLLARLIESGGGSGGGGTNPFTIAGASKRETLHHRLVERTSRSRRTPSFHTSASAATPGASPTPNSALSHRLLDAPGRTPTPRFTSAPTPLGAPSLSPLRTPATAEQRRAKAKDALTPAARMLYHAMGHDARSKRAGTIMAGAFDETGDEAGRRVRTRARGASVTPQALMPRRPDLREQEPDRAD